MDTVKNKLNTGRAELALAAVLWGLAGVCVKSIEWSSMSLMAARSIISLAMLLIYKRSLKVNFTRTNLLGALLMSATGILYVEAIKLTTAGTAIVLQYIAPILVFLYSVVFQHRKAKLIEILITFAVFGGCVLSFADNLDLTKVTGNLLGLASGAAFAGQIIIMSRSDSDSDDCLLISNGISFLVCLPFLFFDSRLVFDTKNIVWILILGIFQYGFANIFFSRGIKKVDKIEASLILTIEPIFNPIPVALLGIEKMGALAVAGSVIVIVFVSLYGLLPGIEERRKSK